MKRESIKNTSIVLSLIISVVALCISVLGFYYNYLYEHSQMDIYVFDSAKDIIMSKKINFDMAFTNNGNRQIMLKEAKCYFSNDNNSKFYFDQTSIPSLPIIINPNQIVHLKVNTKYNANELYESIDPNFKGVLSGFEHLKGRQREATIWVEIDAMDYKGNSKQEDIRITRIMVADNNIIMVKHNEGKAIKKNIFK